MLDRASRVPVTMTCCGGCQKSSGLCCYTSVVDSSDALGHKIDRYSLDLVCCDHSVPFSRTLAPLYGLISAHCTYLHFGGCPAFLGHAHDEQDSTPVR